jgi:hypothetical protein
MPKRHAHLMKLESSGRAHERAVLAEDREIAAILDQADRDCDAGLGLADDAARSFLEQMLVRARSAVGRTDLEPG